MGYKMGGATDAIERDHFGRPKLPDPRTGNWRYWTRPSTMDSTLSDKFGLNKFDMRMVAKGIGLRDDLYAMAAATPLTDSHQLDKIAKDAKEAAAASRGANLGTALHTFTEQLDRGEMISPPAPWDKDIAAYQMLMAKAGLRPVADRIERMCFIPEVDCAGSFDRQYNIADYKPVTEAWTQPRPRGIGDVKTGKTVGDFGWLEFAIQLAIYSRATHVWHGQGDLSKPPYGWEELPPLVDQNYALIIHLPSGKAEATIWELDIATGWEAALECVAVRNWRNRKGLAVSGLSTINVADHMRKQIEGPTVTPESLCDLIVQVSSEDDLTALWRRHHKIWGEPHTALAKRAKQRIANGESLPTGFKQMVAGTTAAPTEQQLPMG